MGNHAGVVDLLLSSNASVDIGNMRIGLKSTPLVDAAHKNDCATARKLIHARANLNIVGQRGLTPLHLAVRSRHELMARILIEAGCDTNVMALGMTAAQFAAKNGMDIEPLLNKGGEGPDV